MKSLVRSDINITPLIDIVLVLLLVFIVFLGVDKGYTPRLPLRGRAAPTPGVDPLLLKVAPDGALELGGLALPSADLEVQLRQVLATRAPEDRRVVLKVDGEGRFQQAVDLLHRLHAMDPGLPVLLR
jgi:biopolymer transport protein ExbD